MFSKILNYIREDFITFRFISFNTILLDSLFVLVFDVMFLISCFNSCFILVSFYIGCLKVDF